MLSTKIIGEENPHLETPKTPGFETIQKKY